MTRPLPAYAKAVAEARRRGLTLRDRGVSVQLHWGRRPTVGYGVVVADDRNPEDCDWTWVRGLDVMIYQDGDAGDRVAQAVAVIETCHPRRLLVVDFIDAKIISFISPPEHDRAAA